MLPVFFTVFQRLTSPRGLITNWLRGRKDIASWVAMGLVGGAIMPSVAEALRFLGCDWEIVGNCIVGYCHWPIIGEFIIRICIG